MTEKIAQLEQMVIDLQSQLTFVDDTIEVLNQVIAKQNQQLSEQQRQLQLLYQKVVTLPQNNPIQPFDLLMDKPPHY